MARIYADNAATTQMRPEVLKAMLPYFSKEYGNASSLHKEGAGAKTALEEARAEIAKAINATPEEIIFTSGGTEADNLAIKGVALANKAKGDHIIVSSIEHPAVLRAAQALEVLGFKITYLPVDPDGFVSLADVRSAITKETIMISVMHANNEIGTIEPIAGIGSLAKEKGIVFHTDAVQSFGKVPIDVKRMDIDLLSLSAHKIYGPKGIGALYVRKGIPLLQQTQGGPQEGGRRAGTENVAGAVGFATAAQLAIKEMPRESRRLTKLRDLLIMSVIGNVEGARLNGHATRRLPGNANFSFKRIEGEALIMMLDEKGIAASTGSACSSHELKPSHVILALGLSPEVAHSSTRVTLGKYNTEAHVRYIARVLQKEVNRLREISKGMSVE